MKLVKVKVSTWLTKLIVSENFIIAIENKPGTGLNWQLNS